MKKIFRTFLRFLRRWGLWGGVFVTVLVLFFVFGGSAGKLGEFLAVPVEPDPKEQLARSEMMQIIKTRGCVADGLLSGYGGSVESTAAMISRSECGYVHRALETWRTAPDFESAEKIMAQIDRPDLIYGMFIAEAISTKAKLYYPAEDRYFAFSKMCRPGSKNFWGEHTCKPSLNKAEYRKYVQYISERAMDLGITSFMFGQVFFQDSRNVSQTRMPEVISGMREFAAFSGKTIVIGAQTNDIASERYLRLFDYIEGGVGLQRDGAVENGPCFSRWYKKPGDWCWALLWHDRFKSRSNDVLVHFDWSGKRGDDMSTFARMSDAVRARTLRSLHAFFAAKDVGFLMPMLAVLPPNNGGCSGSDPEFYTPNKLFSCADEDVINAVLSES